MRGSSPLPAADSTLTRPRCRRGAPTGPPLTPPALALSTARLCQPSLPCQPCLRVRLAVPAAGTGCGLGWAGFVPGEPWEGEPRSRDRPTCVSNRRCPAGIRGLQLDFLELGSNRAGWLQVWRRHRAPGDVPVSAGHPAGMGMGGGAALTPCSPQWQVQFDCFPAESGRRVLVTLRTIPDRGLAVSRSHVVAIELQGKAGRERGARKGWHRLTLPVLPRTRLPEARAIEVAVPKGPALMVRLCHQLALECEELPQPFHRQVTAGGMRSPGVPALPACSHPLCACSSWCRVATASHCHMSSWCPAFVLRWVSCGTPVRINTHSDGRRVADTRCCALLPRPPIHTMTACAASAAPSVSGRTPVSA